MLCEKESVIKYKTATYFNKPNTNALNLTSPSVTASSLLILNTSSLRDFVIEPTNRNCRYEFHVIKQYK